MNLTAPANAPVNVDARAATADPAKVLEVRGDFYRSLAGFILFAGIMVFIDWTFWTVIPRWLMLSWIAGVALFQLFWLGFIVMTIVREPVEPEVSRVWEPLSRWVIYGTNSVCILTIWIFMPYAGDMLRLALVVFCTMFVPITIMTATEASQSDNLTNFGTCLSVAGVYALWGGSDRWVYVAFALGYCVVMRSLGIHFRSAFREKEAARRQSEQLSQSLVVALGEARAGREAISRFLASASHDLGQPLQAARMFFDAAQRNPEGEKHDRALQNVEWAFGTMEQQLNGIMDFLRLESGSISPKPGSLAIGSVMARVAEMHEPAAQLAGAEIHVFTPALHAQADQAFAERAISNLIANAIRHAKASRIVIGARRRGKFLRIWVIDDGVGVPLADQPRLFEDYAQGSDHGDETRGGFGLGLGSARRLCEAMGGAAGFEPRWNKGSAFWLDLPAA